MMATTEPSGSRGETETALWRTLPNPVEVDPGRFRSETHMFSQGLLIREGVFRVDGGEIMAHTIAVVERSHPGRRVVALNTVFAREGRHENPTDYEMTDLYTGRNFGFVSVLASQPGRGPVAHSQLTLSADLEGPAHQGIGAPDVDFTGAVADMDELLLSPIAVAGGRPLGDPDPGEPRAQVRLPVPAELADATEVRMYLSFALDHIAIAPALRPHAGIGYRTKRQFYTAPMALQLRFFGEPAPGSDLVLDMVSPVMRAGLGTAVVYGFDGEGSLVLSCGMDIVARVAD
jgi:acyl-CoA thioesterase-2